MLKDILNMPITDFLKGTSQRTKKIAKKILASKHLSPEQRILFKKGFEKAGITVDEGFSIEEWIKENPGEVAGIALILIIGLTVTIIAWWAGLVWLIIVGAATVGKIKKEL